MNILAIDTITPALSVTASGPDGFITLSVSDGGQHAERMVGVIEQALKQAGFSARETELVACAEGPGSFTGLRLAYSAAKGIQLAANCPLFPVPPLPCYAEPHSRWPGAVISVLDAKKQRFYLQVFRRGIAVTEALDCSAGNSAQYFDSAEKILITGPDAELFAEELSQHFPVLDIYIVPSPQNGISDRFAKFAERNLPYYTQVVPDHAGPVYVRKSDAETSRSE